MPAPSKLYCPAHSGEAARRGLFWAGHPAQSINARKQGCWLWPVLFRIDHINGAKRYNCVYSPGFIRVGVAVIWRLTGYVQSCGDNILYTHCAGLMFVFLNIRVCKCIAAPVATSNGKASNDNFGIVSALMDRGAVECRCAGGSMAGRDHSLAAS